MPAPYVKGSPTSASAATSVQPHLNRIQSDIVDCIRASGAAGMTCDAVEEALDLRHQTASARMKELVDRGDLVKAGTRATRSGRQASVHYVVGCAPAKIAVNVQDIAAPARTRDLQTATHFARHPLKVAEGVCGGKYHLVATIDEFDYVFAEAMKQSHIAVDTETTGLNWTKSKICGFVLGWGADSNFYFPIRHTTNEKQLPASYVIPKMKELLGRTDTHKFFINGKYDRHMLRNDGIEVGGVSHDGVVLSFLLDENSDHSLKGLAKIHIHKDAAKWDKELDKWRTEEARRRRAAYGVVVKDKIAELRKDDDVLAMIEDRVAAIKLTGKRGSVAVELRKHAKEILHDHPFANAKKKDVTYADVPVSLMFQYACADTHYTWVLCRKFLAQVAADPDLRALYMTEAKLASILLDVETTGLKIDIPYLESAGPKLDTEIERFAESIFSDVGYRFNIDSDADLVTAFKKEGVTLTKLTKKSQELQQKGALLSDLKYSVDAEVLETLASKYDFARAILDYRSSRKLRRTYVDGILDLVDEEGYLHSNFNQNVSTGRMSSSAPNVQNIPSRDRTIRRSFIVPDDDYVFVFIDYSQIELRLTAHYSQDPSLLACYPFEGKGTDVHSLTTAEVVMDVAYDLVLEMAQDKDGHDDMSPLCVCQSCTVKFFRTIAKRVNFGIVYGAGAKTIQRQVTTPTRPVTEQECKLYIDKYFRKYPNVKRWITETERYVRTHGHVQNSFGRYRRFPNLSSLEFWQQQRAARQAVNFLIQGTAADLFKEAITRVWVLLKGKKTKLVNFVHDEMQFYWHKSELGLLKEVKHAMEDFDFDVPIIAEVAYSKTDWASKKELAAA